MVAAGRSLARWGAYDDIMAVRVARQKGFVDALYQTERSHVPAADDPPIVYPDAEAWKELTARRKEKYGSTELSRRSPAEKKIEEALKQPTQIEFVETPLKDVVDYLKDLHHIEIQLDAAALKEAGVDESTPVTKNLKGISLRSALKLLLDDLQLKYVIHNEVLLITTPAKAESDEFMTTKVYPVADIVLPIKADRLPGGFGGLGGSRRNMGNSEMRATVTHSATATRLATITCRATATRSATAITCLVTVITCLVTDSSTFPVRSSRTGNRDSPAHSSAMLATFKRNSSEQPRIENWPSLCLTTRSGELPNRATARAPMKTITVTAIAAPLSKAAAMGIKAKATSATAHLMSTRLRNLRRTLGCRPKISVHFLRQVVTDDQKDHVQQDQGKHPLRAPNEFLGPHVVFSHNLICPDAETRQPCARVNEQVAAIDANSFNGITERDKIRGGQRRCIGVDFHGVKPGREDERRAPHNDTPIIIFDRRIRKHGKIDMRRFSPRAIGRFRRQGERTPSGSHSLRHACRPPAARRSDRPVRPPGAETSRACQGPCAHVRRAQKPPRAFVDRRRSGPGWPS